MVPRAWWSNRARIAREAFLSGGYIGRRAAIHGEGPGLHLWNRKIHDAGAKKTDSGQARP